MWKKAYDRSEKNMRMMRMRMRMRCRGGKAYRTGYQDLPLVPLLYPAPAFCPWNPKTLHMFTHTTPDTSPHLIAHSVVVSSQKSVVARVTTPTYLLDLQMRHKECFVSIYF